MKKIFTIALFALLSLLLLCACTQKAPAETEPADLTYADIYEANRFPALSSNHSSILKIQSDFYGGEFTEVQYFWNKSGFAYYSYPYADDEGNSVRDLSYITDNAYLHLEPATAETAAYDLFDYYQGIGYSTPENIGVFELVEPIYNQTITECKKTDSGFEATGENCAKELVSQFCAAYFPEKEYTDGDKILFKLVLNEKNEVLKFENYYVFADGSETVKTTYGELIYDASDCPDYVKHVSSVMEKGAKSISVQVHTDSGIIERTVYSDELLLYTDCEVYSDAEYTNLLTSDEDYYSFALDKDITLYLKTPAS